MDDKSRTEYLKIIREENASAYKRNKMPPKCSCRKISKSVNHLGPVQRRAMVKRSSISVGGKSVRVKQSLKESKKRSMSVTPRKITVKETTKREKTVTFKCNSPRRSISATTSKPVMPKKLPPKNYSTVGKISNYTPCFQNRIPIANTTKNVVQFGIFNQRGFFI